MTETKNMPWYRRWFGGVGWKPFLSAVPFSVYMLLIPLLPTLGVYFIVKRGQAPMAFVVLLLLSLGFPFLRVKRPRLAWWIGTLAAVGSFFGLAMANVLMGTFFGSYTAAVWGLAIAFLVVNWKTLRWWTFAAAGIFVLVQIVPLGVGRTVLTVIGMLTLVPYFFLPNRDNFPRLPIVVTFVMTLLVVHGANFYFNVGGYAEVKNSPAARKVFEYESQKRGWAGVLGTNTRFLTPSCNGEKFYVGTKFSMRSGLTEIDPATGKHQTKRMRGGATDNIALDCQSGNIYIGNMGLNTVMELDPVDLKRPVRFERMDGVRVGMLKLDRRMNRLYVASSNTHMLHMLRASDLADQGGVELGNSVTDIAIDFRKGHDVLTVDMNGEVVRINAHTGQIVARAKVPFGVWIYNIALDPRNRRVFVNSLLSRQMIVLNADTLEEIARERVRKGSRYMQYDPRRDLLYVANFYTGQISAYDSVSLKEVWSMRVGKRVRYLTLDLGRDQLCFSSQVGGYCLQLEELSPRPTNLPPGQGEEATPAQAEGVSTEQAATPEGEASPPTEGAAPAEAAAPEQPAAP